MNLTDSIKYFQFNILIFFQTLTFFHGLDRLSQAQCLVIVLCHPFKEIPTSEISFHNFSWLPFHRFLSNGLPGTSLPSCLLSFTSHLYTRADFFLKHRAWFLLYSVSLSAYVLCALYNQQSMLALFLYNIYQKSLNFLIF